MTLWYLARAAGMVALVAASVSVSLGALGSAGRATDARRRDQRILRQLAHRAAGAVTLTMLLLHVALVVTDRYVNLSVTGALVPLTAGYRAAALGLGTLAAYGFVIVAMIGFARGRLASSASAARAWRAVHGAAYLVWVLAMAHGLLAGTDNGMWWSWVVYAVCGLAVVTALAVRLDAGWGDAGVKPSVHRPLVAGRVR